MSEKVLNYLPEYYRDIQDYIELDGTESAELSDLASAVKQLYDDQFVLTSSAQAVKRREVMLDIQADPSTETLAFRKQRILNRYQTKPPFTVRWLQQQLDRLVGPGMVVVSVDVQNFYLYVTTNIENANLFGEVQHTIQTVKPANVVYQQITSIKDAIVLEEYITKQEINWHYDLGAWQLGEEPFATLGPEVVIK